MDKTDVKSQDYYQLLGVDNHADATSIKRAYRQKIAHCHPDRKAGDDEMVKLLNAAYATLKDEQKRQAYDRHLAYLRQRQWLFAKKAQLRHAKGRWLNKAADMAFVVDTRRLILTKASKVVNRWANHLKQAWQSLQTADGTVVICRIDIHTAYHGGVVQVELGNPPRQFRLTLPKGLTDGQIISIKTAEGSFDMQISIDEPSVQIQGADVHYTAYLTQKQASKGAKIGLPPPWSLDLFIKAQASYPASIVLAGQGLPSESGAGDLIVHLRLNDDA